ncbi:MAG TPA: hypothetical protein VKR53_18300 [Puia sp.]|nr:hypothetical protein [Puia sp.]
MGNLEYIESYFCNELSPGERVQFEQKIINDKVFAEEVAFYCSAKQMIKNELDSEKKEQFRKIYQQTNASHQSKINATKIWLLSASAAAIVAIVFGWYLFEKPVSTPQLADKYILEHFQTLGIRMSSRQDSLEIGEGLYNDGKFPEALQQFERIIKNNTESFEAKKYAGIVSLKLKNYDKALAYFSQIENDSVFSNPAKIYKAITLMERNNAGDKEQAKELLHQIIQNNLDEKETAAEWLKKKW